MSNELLIHHPQVYRDAIVQFGSALRHGMIPNLLDSGVNPRFNARDTCWWFVRGVKEYMRQTKDYGILKEKVNMLFLSNDPLEHKEKLRNGSKKVMTL
jgi:glycogen debranching enzyme